MTTLLTSAQRFKLIDNGNFHQSIERNGADPLTRFDPFPVVKLFTPDANATWLLVELDPEDSDLAFGLWGAPHNPNYVDRRIMGSPPRRTLNPPHDLRSVLAITACSSLHPSLESEHVSDNRNR